MSIATEIARLQQAKADLKTAINAKGRAITDESLDQYAAEVDLIEVGGGGGAAPTTSQSMFTGATIPLTYKDNTHISENTYVYKSLSYNITIAGLTGLATITGNGTKEVTVIFDVTSSTTALNYFTITCSDGLKSYTYNGLHAHYGSTVTGILTLAYKNASPNPTSPNSSDYLFISTSSTDVPYFETNTILWNGVYSHQILNLLMGNFSSTSIGNYFLNYCYSFNQPLDISGVTSIGNYFMYYCPSFNQPLDISGVTSIGTNFMQSCFSFKQPLDISGVTSIGTNFMYYCYSFNQPLDISGVTSIGNYFMYYCHSFNQPLDIGGVTSIGTNFMYYCHSFNQPLDISGVTSIVTNFMYYCYSFNQPLDISGVTSIGNYFMYYCPSFNQPLDISGVTSIGNYFMSSCYSFNQPLDIGGVTSIGEFFLNACYSFNQPLDISGVTSIGNYFMYYCHSLSIIIWNSSVYPTDSGSLSQSINTKTSASGYGIKVYGTKRSNLMAALPNITFGPYRKLVDGGF